MLQGGTVHAHMKNKMLFQDNEKLGFVLHVAFRSSYMKHDV